MKIKSLTKLFGAGALLIGTLATATPALADTTCPWGWASPVDGGYLGGMDCVDPSNRWIGISMYAYTGSTRLVMSDRWGGNSPSGYKLSAKAICSDNSTPSKTVTNTTPASVICPSGTTVLLGGGSGRVF